MLLHILLLNLILLHPFFNNIQGYQAWVTLF